MADELRGAAILRAGCLSHMCMQDPLNTSECLAHAAMHRRHMLGCLMQCRRLLLRLLAAAVLGLRQVACVRVPVPQVACLNR